MLNSAAVAPGSVNCTVTVMMIDVGAPFSSVGVYTKN